MKDSTSNNDIHLIKRVKEGDTHAFRMLVEKHKDVSLSLAYSVLKNKKAAEDVLQDSFVKVFHKIDTFKFKSSFTTWLYRIVVNTSYNVLKRDKKYNETTEVNSIYSHQLKANASEILRKGDQKKYIDIALTKIRTDEALVLRLFYLCEYKISEIEKITGFKTSKVKTTLHRGRNNLQEQLINLLGTEIYDLL